MKANLGFEIKIFLPSGDPNGLRIVEKSNWTGKGIVCARSQFLEIKRREEFKKTGVYILAGPTSETELQKIYIGEGDPVGSRLEQHASKKDFWTILYFFVSKDDSLNKAHIKYLESRMIQSAIEVKRCELDNGNKPNLPSLSEADAAEAGGFFNEMLLLFPVLGLVVFEKPKHEVSQEKILYLKRKGIEGKGYESPQGFVVVKGSQAVIQEVPSTHGYVSEMRKNFMKNGILKINNDMFVMTEDHVFSSPSTAAGFLLGASANGRVEWKNKSGKKLKELQ